MIDTELLIKAAMENDGRIAITKLAKKEWLDEHADIDITE
jgi:hypothetical protein